jgi:hypothetical protein
LCPIGQVYLGWQTVARILARKLRIVEGQSAATRIHV